MTPWQLHDLLDIVACALADLPPDVREPVDVALSQLASAYIDRLSEVSYLRQLHLCRDHAYRRLFERLWEASAS